MDYKKQSKAPTGTRQNSKQKQHQQSPKKVVGGKKEGKKMEEKLNSMSECLVCKSFSFELGLKEVKGLRGKYKYAFERLFQSLLIFFPVWFGHCKISVKSGTCIF